LALLAAGGAGFLAFPFGDPVRRLDFDHPHSARLGEITLTGRPGGRLAAWGLAVLALSVTGSRRGLLAVAGGFVVVAIARGMVRTRRRRQARRLRQRDVLAMCDDLSAELRAGIPTLTAVDRACAGRAELGPVSASARLGGDVSAALRRCAERPGAEGLRAVAAAWEVANTSGASLAVVVDRIAAGLRSDDDARAEVLASLGPPRATARLLAVLPLFGLALGSSIGADPIRFLVGTPWGLGCLITGAVLALAGIWWVERLASAAEI
jgi:tight adherence protein B